MRRALLLLLALAACSKREEAKAPGPPAATADDSLGSPATAAVPLPRAPTAAPAPASPLTTTPAPGVIAVRNYERLVNGRRAGTMRVRWTAVERDGRKLVQDVTESKERSVRDMAGTLDKFSTDSRSTILRTEEGELISEETVVTTSARIDRETVERTPAGYTVTRTTGDNKESFDIATEKPAMLDAEAFLVSKITKGEASPGASFTVPLLDTGRRRVVEATLRVVGPDSEGPGLKVVQTLDGEDMLWWFAEDGSVTRIRSGITVIRRDDRIRLDDLPARPASYRITLPSNVDLPRIFTTRQMLVDILVQTDETTKPPKIPPSPFTEVVERTEKSVSVLLKSADDPAATCPLPIDPKGFEEYLKPTSLMEVDDPEVRTLAREIVGGAKDAREAARRLAEYVFSTLVKESPAIAEPTMKEILREQRGDCSEHSLLFTGLCRAAGIPARRCSGWVCIGEDWGAHGWCEIWVGRWIGADPTTNEIGTRARYIMFSRPDEPDVLPGRITAERTKLVIRRAEYVDGSIDFDKPGDPDLEILSGIRLGPVPEGWTVTRARASVRIDGPDFRAAAGLSADQGYRSMDLLTMQLPGGKEGAFGGRPAAVGMGGQRWWVSLGREILDIRIQMRERSSEPPMEALAKLLAPTLERAE